MDINTKYRVFRLNYIEGCLKNSLKKYTKPNLIDELNDAISQEFGEEKKISDRTFNTDFKFIKDALEDNGLQLISRKEGKQCYYKYSDTDFTINDIQLTQKEIKRLTNAIGFLKQIKGIDLNDELIDILQKLDAQVKYHSNKEITAIGFQQTEAAAGYEYIDDLYDAIIEKTVIEISYKPYHAEAETKIVHPYHLRQYNNRWFLFGWDEAFARVSNFALDRFTRKPKPTNNNFKDADGVFDPATYFKNIIGVTRFENNPVEIIKLQVAEKRMPYLITKPLHETQQYQQLKNGIFELTLELSINNELKQLILSYGSDVEVIGPKGLREFVKKQAYSIINNLFIAN